MPPTRRDDELERTTSEDSQAVTYVKWGLMGLGALTAIGLIGKLLGLLLNPVVLLVVAGVGAAWWFVRRSPASADTPAEPPARAEAPGRPASRDDVVSDSLRRSRDASEDFDRRMRELDALRDRMHDEDDAGRR